MLLTRQPSQSYATIDSIGTRTLPCNGITPVIEAVVVAVVVIVVAVVVGAAVVMGATVVVAVVVVILTTSTMSVQLASPM